MKIRNISNEELLKELENKENIKIYNCGLYGNYHATITKKYSNDRRPIEFPEDFELIIITK